MASQAWLLAGLSVVIGMMYVVGKRVDPNRGMVFACLYAGYSLFPLLDAWLCGRRMPLAQKQLLRYIGLDYLRGVGHVSGTGDPHANDSGIYPDVVF
jgi:hypothetical protein